jgi:hypothetical protein
MYTSSGRALAYKSQGPGFNIQYLREKSKRKKIAQVKMRPK